MSKKNRKPEVIIEGLTFNYVENSYRCPCGGEVVWTGGRYADKAHSHMMEVLTCTRCGHSTDPRLVFERALEEIAKYEARKDAYKAEAARKAQAAEEARKEAARVAAYNRTLRGKIDRLFAFAH